MTNLQLWLAIGIPSFMVLVGILLNLRGSGRLEDRISALENIMNNRFTVIEGDLRRFYELLGEHSGRIEGCSVRITNLERK